MITIPETWEWNPLDDKGKPLFKKGPIEFELGGGRIKVFSLDQEDFAIVRDESVKMTVASNGEMVTVASDLAALESLFSARCGGRDGSWVDFLDEDGEPLNSNSKNQKHFAHFQGLNYFVTRHVGPMLDRIANDEASEEEKNWFASPDGFPDGANESTPGVAEAAKKPGPKK